MRHSFWLAPYGLLCVVGLSFAQEGPSSEGSSPASDAAIRNLLKTPVQQGYFDAKMLEAQRERERAEAEAALRAAENALKNRYFPAPEPPVKSSDTVKNPPVAVPDPSRSPNPPPRKPTEAELQGAVNKAKEGFNKAHENYIAANNAVAKFERQHGIPTLPREAQDKIASSRVLRDLVDPNMPIRTIKDPSGFDSPRPPSGARDIDNPQRGTDFFPGRDYRIDPKSLDKASAARAAAELKAVAEAKAAAAKKAREREYLDIQRQQERGLLDVEAAAIESDDQKLRSRGQTRSFKAADLKARIDAHNKERRIFHPGEEAALAAYNARAASLNAEVRRLLDEEKDYLAESSRLQKRKSDHATKLTAHQQKWATLVGH